MELFLGQPADFFVRFTGRHEQKTDRQGVDRRDGRKCLNPCPEGSGSRARAGRKSQLDSRVGLLQGIRISRESSISGITVGIKLSLPLGVSVIRIGRELIAPPTCQSLGSGLK